MKYKKDILIILLIIFTVIQYVIFIGIKKDKEGKSELVVSKIENEPTYIRDINKNLVKLKNYNVTNIKREEGEWLIDMELKCTKDEMIYNLNLLDNFIIKKYSLTFSENMGTVNLELKSR